MTDNSSYSYRAWDGKLYQWPPPVGWSAGTDGLWYPPSNLGAPVHDTAPIPTVGPQVLEQTEHYPMLGFVEPPAGSWLPDRLGPLESRALLGALAAIVACLLIVAAAIALVDSPRSSETLLPPDVEATVPALAENERSQNGAGGTAPATGSPGSSSPGIVAAQNVAEDGTSSTSPTGSESGRPGQPTTGSAPGASDESSTSTTTESESSSTTRPGTTRPDRGATTRPTSPPGPQCDPNYTPCVPVASDVDCAGGTGDGPAYVQGPVRVIGSDIYGLDRDGNGIGCEGDGGRGGDGATTTAPTTARPATTDTTAAPATTTPAPASSFTTPPTPTVPVLPPSSTDTGGGGA